MIQLNDTTYSIPGLGDRLTAPVITLGGKDPKKFALNLNIGFDFGGGEEYFDNLNRTDKIITAKSEIKHDGKRVSIIEGSDIDEIYTDDLGRVKWDVVFEKCPESFVLEWRRTCSPGLTAYYQPALTEEEIREGAYRPDDVIGSYAIYCDRAHNWIRPLNRKKEIPDDWQVQRAAGAELGDLNISAYREYKTGKVAHRYRPFVVDANGKTAWCTLLIIGNIELVTLPEEFMKSAKYPVRLDPDFGNTSVGGSTDFYTGSTVAARAYGTPASSGSLDSISLYGRAYSATHHFNAAIYSDSSGPSARLGYNLSGPTMLTTAQWNVCTVSYTGITSGTQYWLAFDERDALIYFNFDSASGEGRYTSTSPFPETWSGNGSMNYRISIYATYTESGGATGHPTASRFRGMHRNNNVRYA